MIRRPPRSTPLYSSAASDVYKRQCVERLRPIGGIRGSSAAAPLKHRRVHIQRAVVGVSAAHQPRPHCSPKSYMAPPAAQGYPRLISRGPIEAVPPSPTATPKLAYLRLISRGPIEARLIDGVQTTRYLVTAAQQPRHH